MPDRITLPTPPRPDLVVVCDPSPLANPFHVDGPNHLGLGAVRDAEHAAWLYGRVIATPSGLLRDDATARLATLHRTVHTMLPTLTGKDLACTCPPGVTCHADLLLAMANQTERVPL